MPSTPVSRRHFLGGAAAVGGAVLTGCTSEAPVVPAAEAEPSATKVTDPGDGILVLVNLDGGNDGLNTVCPVTDGRYRSLRGSLALDPAKTHEMSEGFVLHPSLTSFKRMWDAGNLGVVHGVGFEGLDRSHFHCRDVWQAARSERVTTGWLGRWLDDTGGDALTAVAVDRLLPLVLRGETNSGGVVPSGAFMLPDMAALGDSVALMAGVDSRRSDLASAVARSTADLLEVVDVVSPVLGEERSGSDEIGNPEGLTAKLDAVAALISAGVATRVFTVQLGGFDTHAGQAPTHAALLAELDRAVDNLLRRTVGHPVTVAVWSEFGRRVTSNASGGTDHGKASVMLLAGRVAGGHHGDPPGLDRLDDGDLATTVDFRSVLGGLAQGVLGIDAGRYVGTDHPVMAVV
ncbi:MAG: DUF1501 domain-containing protein [Microthrixaceae bacterium]|nr:DUF1501 domain-containing protein [Acidimicrobiales bacterium]MCB9404915.1 DUF1501 domain-containing protein [Microthrixaceae bacterium]